MFNKLFERLKTLMPRKTPQKSSVIPFSFCHYEEEERIAPLASLMNIFDTGLYKDRYGNEFVLLRKTAEYFSELDKKALREETKDKTQFEALDTHVHLLDNVTKAEFDAICSIAEPLCRLLAGDLIAKYTGKSFVVYLSAVIGDGLIMRFHQTWPGELPYYASDYKYGDDGLWMMCSDDMKLISLV